MTETAPVGRMSRIFFIPALSENFKLSVKVALATVLTYWFIFSMGWERPYWGALAVVMCSLGSVGGSLLKGLSRIMGTLVAVLVAIILISAFSQDRWLFLGCMTVYIAVCVYIMTGSKRFYFWYVAAFVVPILSLDGVGDSVQSFYTVISRAQNTMTGVIIFTLVSVLLWRQSSRDIFDKAFRSMLDAQHQLLKLYVGLMAGGQDDGSAEKLRAQALRTGKGLPALLDSAVYDSFEVREVRRVWQDCIGSMTELDQALERWRNGFHGLKESDPETILPNLQSFTTVLDARFAAIQEMLSGQPAGELPGTPELSPDAQALESLSQFHRAALQQTVDQLHEIDRLTRALFVDVIYIQGFADAPSATNGHATAPLSLVPDPDRLASTVRAFASVWMAILFAFYVPDFPQGGMVVNLATSVSAFIAMMPQLSIAVAIKPVVVSMVFAGAVYMLVMPQLSGFHELAVLIFIVIFAICYLFPADRNPVGRTVGLAVFVVMIAADQNQAYSFDHFAAFAIAAPCLIGILIVTRYVPLSLRPERVFRFQIRRFFRSAAFLMASAVHDPEFRSPSLFQTRYAFHVREVATLPAKLVAWGGALPAAALGSSNRQEVQSLVATIEALDARLRELVEVREAPQAKFLVGELSADMRRWRVGVEEIFRHLSENPGAEDPDDLRARLDALTARFEQRIQETLDRAQNAISPQEAKSMYRLLGAYRGVSEALVTFSRQAGSIDWPCLRESRF